MTIVASGYGLRENKRQRFLILVFLVPDDLKTREFQILIKMLSFSDFFHLFDNKIIMTNWTLISVAVKVLIYK